MGAAGKGQVTGWMATLKNRNGRARGQGDNWRRQRAVLKYFSEIASAFHAKMHIL